MLCSVAIIVRPYRIFFIQYDILLLADNMCQRVYKLIPPSLIWLDFLADRHRYHVIQRHDKTIAGLVHYKR